jgi:hypothetical protein
MGSLAAARDFDLASLRTAVVTGAVLASFNVEGFGPHGLEGLSVSDVEDRFRAVQALVAFTDR